MSGAKSEELTELLEAWSNGDEKALEILTPVIYAELHRLARHYMRHERPNHILQTTALVNEAYIRLINWKTAKWDNRSHFFGVSAKLMRRILVDFARERPQVGGVEVWQVTLGDPADAAAAGVDTNVVKLHEALKQLETFDSRKAQIVELKFFGGLKVEEIAGILKIAPITVMRDWKKAKAWLFLELSE